MRVVLFLLGSAMCLWGCATGDRRELRSQWDALQEADAVECADIPMKKDDLRIDRVHVIEDLGPSLLVEVTNRRGVKGLQHLTFQSLRQLQEDRLVVLPVSQGSNFLGAGVAQGKAVFLLKTSDKGKPVVQVRDLSNNAVITTHPIDAKGPWELGAWSMEKSTLRALVREEKDEESIDDQPYLQFEWSPAFKDGEPLRTVLAPDVIGEASLFSDSKGRSFVLWLDRGTSDKVRTEPRHRIIPWRAGTSSSAEIADQGKIESWAFLEGSDHNLIVSIKGDTLLWENSAIELVRIAKLEPFVREATQNVPLKRVHVAKPLLMGGAQSAYLLLPQWLDHELTMAVFEFKDQNLDPKGFVGVFEQGSSFYRAFYHEPSRSYLVLLSSKTKGAFLGRYKLCKVAV